MTETFVQIVFGWPAIIASIFLSVAGLMLKKTPLGSTCAIQRGKYSIGWLLIAPLVIVGVLLAYVVLTQ